MKKIKTADGKITLQISSEELKKEALKQYSRPGKCPKCGNKAIFESENWDITCKCPKCGDFGVSNKDTAPKNKRDDSSFQDLMPTVEEEKPEDYGYLAKAKRKIKNIMNKLSNILPVEEDVVPCEICGMDTRMTGTKRCDTCWEIEKTIQTNTESSSMAYQTNPDRVKVIKERIASSEEELKKMAMFGTTDWAELGPTPSGEECVQVGSDNYYDFYRTEARAYANQLMRMFPNPPPGARFSIKSFPHDFGTYHEVVVKYPIDNEEAEAWAFEVQDKIPEYWDEEAKKELSETGYFDAIKPQEQQEKKEIGNAVYENEEEPCPQCGSIKHSISNPSNPTINECAECKHQWNPNNVQKSDSTTELGTEENDPSDDTLPGRNW